MFLCSFHKKPMVSWKNKSRNKVIKVVSSSASVLAYSSC
ncbi:uncharacterized protein J3R85_008659 [Psidium guajava]|nr:uncharacterized protein J3R85_008659 [Psidium guajava]